MATYSDWPDGKAHRIPYAQHLINMRNAAGRPLTLPEPPVGTYDPSIDYQGSASERGYQQTFNDAQTAFERGQQDYGLGVGDLTTRRDRSLADLLTGHTREGEDYTRAGENLTRQYGILGHRQAESAAQRGITSPGLLGKSAATRATNQGREQSVLDLLHTRAGEDYTTGTTRVGEDFTRSKQDLDLGYARQFGGFGGNTILNPLTGKPEVGTLTTGIARAGAENTAFQSALGGQRAYQAAQGGYTSPLTAPNSAAFGYVGRTPQTQQQYQAGVGLEAWLRASARQQGKPYEVVARDTGFDPVTLKRLS